MRVALKNLWGNVFRVNIWCPKDSESETIRLEKIAASYWIKTNDDGSAIDFRRESGIENAEYEKAAMNKIKAFLASKSLPSKNSETESEDESCCKV